MLDLIESKYFLPTKALRELSIMLAIYKDPELSQQSIGVQANLSAAMVNTYLKKMRDEGVVTVREKNKRDRLYTISEKGERILINAMLGCSAELVQHIAKIRKILAGKLVAFFKNHPAQNVVLFGGADTAQFVLESILDVSVVAIVDSDRSKWGTKLNTIVIQPPEILERMQFDTIIICSYAHQEEIYKSIAHMQKREIHIVQLTSI